MLSKEVKALGDLAGAAAAGLAGQIQDMHQGIAQRAFEAVGPGATPVKLVNDRVAEAAYRAARGLSASAVRAGAIALGRARPHDAPSFEQAPAGRVVIGALNGAFGDTLKLRSNALAFEMTVRH